MGLRIRDWVVSFARQLAIDCALIATAFGVAVAAQLIEPLFKRHKTLFAALMRLFR